MHHGFPKIIIVANEEQIKEKEVYDSFKEKVINKTYNITQITFTYCGAIYIPITKPYHNSPPYHF